MILTHGANSLQHGFTPQPIPTGFTRVYGIKSAYRNEAFRLDVSSLGITNQDLESVMECFVTPITSPYPSTPYAVNNVCPFARSVIIVDGSGVSLSLENGTSGWFGNVLYSASDFGGRKSISLKNNILDINGITYSNLRGYAVAGVTYLSLWGPFDNAIYTPITIYEVTVKKGNTIYAHLVPVRDESTGHPNFFDEISGRVMTPQLEPSWTEWNEFEIIDSSNPDWELDIPNFDLTTLTQDGIVFGKGSTPTLSKSSGELILQGPGSLTLDLTQLGSFSKLEFTVSRLTASVAWQTWTHIGSGCEIGNGNGGYASIPTLWVYAGNRYWNNLRRYVLGGEDTAWQVPPSDAYVEFRFIDGYSYYENRNGENTSVQIDHLAYDFYALPLTVRVERENGIESTYWNDVLVSIVDYSSVPFTNEYACNVWRMNVDDSDSSVETAITSLKVWT